MKENIAFHISLEKDFLKMEEARSWHVNFEFEEEQTQILDEIMCQAEDDPYLDNLMGIRSTNDELRYIYPEMFEACDNKAREAMQRNPEVVFNESMPVYWYLDLPDLYSDQFDDVENELETVITGEGNMRHLQYIAGDQLFIQDWLIRDGNVTITYEHSSIDGGEVDHISNIPSAVLAQYYNCKEEEVIDHVMADCKHLDDELNIDTFLSILDRLKVTYTRKRVKDWDIELDWKSGIGRAVNEHTYE